MSNSTYAAVYQWNKRQTETDSRTHLRAEEVSNMACLDMISIRALVVSENFDMSTGTGTLVNTERQ